MATQSEAKERADNVENLPKTPLIHLIKDKKWRGCKRQTH